MKVTVFTPTYNRAHSLGRVYNSLMKQTYKEFIWLIIDDGSTDNTKDVVDSWIKENIIKIDYRYKSNGGKHTAMKLAFATTETKYLIGLDSDDELVPDAIEVFINEWAKIENTELENCIAEIRALSKYNGKLNGNFYFPEGAYFFDLTWHEMVLKKNNHNECISCWNVRKLNESVEIPDTFWLSDRANHYGETILWAQLGRKYKSRYIDAYLLNVHYDVGPSILRNENKEQSHLNGIVLSFNFLNENMNYFWMRPSVFVKSVLFQIIYSTEYKVSILDTVKHITSKKYMFLYLLFYPLGLLLWPVWKTINKLR